MRKKQLLIELYKALNLIDDYEDFIKGIVGYKEDIIKARKSKSFLEKLIVAIDQEKYQVIWKINHK